jgi:hypothetical protein
LACSRRHVPAACAVCAAGGGYRRTGTVRQLPGVPVGARAAFVTAWRSPRPALADARRCAAPRRCRSHQVDRPAASAHPPAGVRHLLAAGGPGVKGITRYQEIPAIGLLPGAHDMDGTCGGRSWHARTFAPWRPGGSEVGNEKGTAVMSFTGVGSPDRSIGRASAWLADIDAGVGTSGRRLAYRVPRGVAGGRWGLPPAGSPLMERADCNARRRDPGQPCGRACRLPGAAVRYR